MLNREPRSHHFLSQFRRLLRGTWGSCRLRLGVTCCEVRHGGGRHPHVRVWRGRRFPENEVRVTADSFGLPCTLLTVPSRRGLKVFMQRLHSKSTAARVTLIKNSHIYNTVWVQYGRLHGVRAKCCAEVGWVFALRLFLWPPFPPTTCTTPHMPHACPHARIRTLKRSGARAAHEGRVYPCTVCACRRASTRPPNQARCSPSHFSSPRTGKE